MKTSIKTLLLSALVMFVSAQQVQAAPFARVVVKNSNATIVELGDDAGLHRVNWMTADFTLNGGSILPAILAGLGSPVAPWSIPNQNTLRIQVNYDFRPWAVGVKICSYAIGNAVAECADNNEMLLRYPTAPGFATNGFQAGTLTMPLAMMSSSIDYGGGAGFFGGTVFPVTVNKPTVVTGFEALATNVLPLSSPPFPHFDRAYVSVYSALSLASQNSHGDLVDLAPAAIELKELYVSDPRVQRIVGSGLRIVLQPGVYWFSVLYESPLGFPLESAINLESVVDLGTAYQHGYNPGATPYFPIFSGFSTGTPALDLRGH